MTCGLLVLLIVFLILFLLLNFYAVVDVKYADGKLNYCIRYSVMKLKSSDKPPKAIKNKSKIKSVKIKKGPEKSETADFSLEKSNAVQKKNNPDKSVKSAKPKKKEKNGKETLNQKLEKAEAIIDFIRSSGEGIIGLVRKIKISKINVDFLVADEDAYECALAYGTVNAGVYNILGFLSSYFQTAIDSVNIGLKYNNNKSIYNFSFSLKLKLGTALGSAAGIFLKYLGAGNLFLKRKKKRENSKECLNMNDHPVNGLMGTAIEKIRDMIDVNTIIGDPITTADGATIIPVSKVSFGFASGGSDLPSKQPKQLFGGAAGAGVSVQPLAFIFVSSSGEVKLLQMSVNATKENAIITTLPDLIDKISGLVNKDSDKKKCDKKKEKTEE